MQTTNLGMSPVKSAMDKKNKIPLNRNIYGSCGFGEVFPHNFKQVEADTDQRLSNETLLYLASVVSPTFGHVQMKFWSYFVAFSDLSRNVAGMLSQTNVVRAGDVLVPTKVPHAPRNLLSLLFLFGAQCSIYKVSVEADNERRYTHPNVSSSSGPDIGNAMSFYGDIVTKTGGLLSSGTETNLFGFKSHWIDARALIDFDFETAGTEAHAIGMKIPLSNPDALSFFHYSEDGGYVTYHDGVDVAPVTIDGADFLIERTFDYLEGGETKHVTYAFAFRMHAFGKRLYKAMKGSEFQEDFTDKTQISLLPFFAVYKGYFDSFGLLLYENWENTACAKLLSMFDDLDVKDFTFMLVSDTDGSDRSLNILSANGQQFIKEFGSMWVTASQDWASMHTRTIGVAPKIDAVSSFDSRFLASTTNSNPATAAAAHINIPAANTEDTAEKVNQHALINSIYHGQLDCELLQRLYLQINRDTLAGKRVEELLRLEGYGRWVDNVKPRFIKFEQIDVNFDKVLSQSDTYKDGNGALLGERGGYGQGYKYGKGYSFHNDEPGYIFTLCAVVPDAGLTNVMNVAFEQIEKLDFFMAQYDALGYEASKIKDVVGQLPFAATKKDGNGVLRSRSNVTEKTFGYAPRSSKFKVVHNVCNGDFARHSVRDYFLTYMLDKVISLGEITQTEILDVTDNDLQYKQIRAFETFAPEDLPLAGNAWRYPTRYPWLGLFTRIFANPGDDRNRYKHMFVGNDTIIKMYEFINNENDVFFFLSTLRGSEMTHKLPISDSFETREDGNGGKSDGVISKA